MTTYATTVSPHPWGQSRQWEAWAELWVGPELRASSARGDFVLVDGRVTEDITRTVCRDCDIQIALPLSPRYSSVAVYTATSSTTSFSVGSSTVGGTDTIGGGTTLTVQSAPALADTQRNQFVPTGLGDLLDPNGPATLHLWAGWAGEAVRLGVFDLSSTPVAALGGGVDISLLGQSFERRIEKAGFWSIENAAAGFPATTAISDLVVKAIADVVVRAGVNGHTTAAISWKPGDSRIVAVQKLLDAAGLQAYFDRDNVYVIEAAPGLDDLAGGVTHWEWDLVDGHNGVVANLHSASHTFSDDESFNGVTIEGTSNDVADKEPIVYTLWNTSPSSPLYFDPDNPTASFTGPRPKYITSDLVRSTADAAAMALTELAKVMLVADQVECEVPANANVQMGQFARFASDALGVDAVYRISRVVHDLGGGPMSLTLSRFAAV